jgi:hypothetical protein
LAKGRTPELNPNAQTPPKPPAPKQSINDMPAQSVHGHQPNFPGEPNPSTDKPDIPGYSKGVDHGWFK